MNSSKRGRATRLALAALGAVGVLAIFVGAAAATIPGTATITGGSLSLTSPPTTVGFGSTQLDGTIKYVSNGPVAFSVTDATGSGAGWNVSASATAFTCDNSSDPTHCATPTSHTLGALEVSGSSDHTQQTAPTLSCTATTECNNLGTSSVAASSYPLTVGTSSTDLFDQPIGSGMGTVDVSSFYWWLTIPVSAYVGTYDSTITLAVNSGP